MGAQFLWQQLVRRFVVEAADRLRVRT